MSWSKVLGVVAAPFTGGASLLGVAVDVGKGLLGDYTAGRKNKRKIANAVALNKIKLAESAQSHNQVWELAQIEGKDKFLRRVSFFMLSAPFVVAIVAPHSVQEYFTVALASMPEWYQYMYVSIIGAIWGISELGKFKGGRH